MFAHIAFILYSLRFLYAKNTDIFLYIQIYIMPLGLFFTLYTDFSPEFYTFFICKAKKACLFMTEFYGFHCICHNGI